jgi:hypothetical protein
MGRGRKGCKKKRKKNESGEGGVAAGQGGFLARGNLTADREYEITLVKARK